MMAMSKTRMIFLFGWLSGLLMMLMMLQIGWLRNMYSRDVGKTPPIVLAADDGYCPPCDLLFSQLQPNSSGRLVQRVEMQMRG